VRVLAARRRRGRGAATGYREGMAKTKSVHSPAGGVCPCRWLPVTVVDGGGGGVCGRCMQEGPGGRSPCAGGFACGAENGPVRLHACHPSAGDGGVVNNSMEV